LVDLLLRDFVGDFPVDANPVLVFLATKMIPVMNEPWMKARTSVIAEGKTIHIRKIKKVLQTDLSYLTTNKCK